LTSRVNVNRSAAGLAGCSTKINHLAVFPEKGVMDLRTREVGSADNFPTTIDPVGFAAVSTEGA
jgi:hypothetical protein